MFSALFKRTIIAVPGACLSAGLLIGTAVLFLPLETPPTIQYANPVNTLLGYMEGQPLGFYNIEIQVWIPCVSILLLLCFLFLSLATELLKFPSRRTYAIPGFFIIVLSILIMVFATGSTIRPIEETPDDQQVFYLALHMLVLSLLAVSFTPSTKPPARNGTETAARRMRNMSAATVL